MKICYYCKKNIGIYIFYGTDDKEKRCCSEENCMQQMDNEEKKAEIKIIKRAIENNKCPYIPAYNEMCLKNGNPYCEKHKNIKCKCGKKAVKECGIAGSLFVCGEPLCENCNHIH